MTKKLEFEEALKGWCEDNGIVWTKREKRLFHLFSISEPESTEFYIEICFGEGSPYACVSYMYLDLIIDMIENKEKFVDFMSRTILGIMESESSSLRLMESESSNYPNAL